MISHPVYPLRTRVTAWAGSCRASQPMTAFTWTKRAAFLKERRRRRTRRDWRRVHSFTFLPTCLAEYLVGISSGTSLINTHKSSSSTRYCSTLFQFMVSLLSSASPIHLLTLPSVFSSSKLCAEQRNASRWTEDPDLQGGRAPVRRLCSDSGPARHVWHSFSSFHPETPNLLSQEATFQIWL